MLFPYPVAATQENWLHECLVEAVKTVHELVEKGKRMPAWPIILPEAHRDRLVSRYGLRDRFRAYANAIRKLSAHERSLVLAALESQNRISELLARQCDCATVAELPEGVRESATALFTFAFDLLTPLEVRRRQYDVICKAIPTRVCPFCGCEPLEAPGAPQEDLDHYLPRSRYPFAAANLHNLAPMGGRCNSAYKKTQDPLRRGTGERRSALDPYGAIAIGVSLDNSVVDEATTGPVVSTWVVDLQPAGEAVDTWDEIFHVRERWRRDVLDDQTFRQWLWDFRNYCLTATLQITGDGDVVDAVKRYEEFLTGSGVSDRAFLKAAVFRFLLRRCRAGCQRLLPILRDLACPPQAQ